MRAITRREQSLQIKEQPLKNKRAIARQSRELRQKNNGHVNHVFDLFFATYLTSKTYPASHGPFSNNFG